MDDFRVVAISLQLFAEFGPKQFIKIESLRKTLVHCNFGIMIGPIEVSSMVFALR